MFNIESDLVEELENKLSWLNKTYIKEWINSFIRENKNYKSLNKENFIRFIKLTIDQLIEVSKDGGDGIHLTMDYPDIARYLGLSIPQAEIILKEFFTHIGFNLYDLDNALTLDWSNEEITLTIIE